MNRSRLETADQHIRNAMMQWTLATVMGLVLFGCFLMLMGGLFACAIVHAGYHRLNTAQIGFVGEEVGDRMLWEFAGWWGGIVALLFGGNALRVLGCREFRRRKHATASQSSRTMTDRRASVRAVIQFLVAPIMLFWCVLCALSLIRWAGMYFSGIPMGMWTTRLRQFDAGTLTNIGLWWLLSVALLCGGIGFIWSALRVLLRFESKRSR